VASAHARQKQDAKRMAAQKALKYLNKLFPTIKVGPTVCFEYEEEHSLKAAFFCLFRK
jgi:hypothetical protein